MSYLGPVLTSPGYSNQGMHVFLAEELTEGPLQRSPEESELVCTRVTVEQFETHVRGGRIKDAGTLSAYALLRMHKRLPG